jgi:hypothetical protein
VVNGAASLGNAAIRHPGNLAAMLAGMLLFTVSSGLEEGGGVPVDSGYPGTYVRLSDGTRVGLRLKSASGGETIDVFKPDNTHIKVHLP